MHRIPSMARCVALLLLVACSNAAGPTIPQAGYYPLRAVDGHALPAPRVLNGCQVSIGGGFLQLHQAPDTFAVRIDYHFACPDTVPGAMASGDGWSACRGPWQSASGSTTVSLNGTDPLGQIGCIFEATGGAAAISGRWGGANRGIWGDPSFDFGPRQESPPGP
jgi:hypothetical protein